MLEDTKRKIRSRKSRTDRQYNDTKKKTKGQAMIYKTLHKQLKIQKHEPKQNPEE